MSDMNPKLVARIAPAPHRSGRAELARRAQVTGLRWRGVWLSSRYARVREIETMRRVLDYILAEGGGEIVAEIESIFWDSKVGAALGVRVRCSGDVMAGIVASYLHDAMQRIHGGHNDIDVTAPDGAWAGYAADWEPRERS